MATTRIMPLHVGKGRTESRAISDIIDYVANPQKTDNGRLIAGFACDSRTVDAEFLLAKRQYIVATGRVRGADDVIAYHVRQSFRPGEITPEEANRLGELHRHDRQAEDEQEDHVTQHESAAAVLTDHPRKFPDVSHADGAACAEQNEAQSRTESFSLHLFVPLILLTSLFLPFTAVFQSAAPPPRTRSEGRPRRPRRISALF